MAQDTGCVVYEMLLLTGEVGSYSLYLLSYGMAQSHCLAVVSSILLK